MLRFVYFQITRTLKGIQV